MKYKTQEPEQEKSGMNKELYDMFIDLIQFEIEKLSFIHSARIYFYHNGYIDYKKFFKHMYKACEATKHCLMNFLIESLEPIPDFTIPALNLEFRDKFEPFEELQKMEDEYAEKINALALKAFEVKDMHVLAYIINKLNEIKHIACIALEAVKNDQNPLDLIECE